LGKKEQQNEKETNKSWQANTQKIKNQSKRTPLMTWEVTDVLLNSKQYLLHWVNPRGVGPNRTVCVGGGGHVFKTYKQKNIQDNISALSYIYFPKKHSFRGGQKQCSRLLSRVGIYTS
jgi:hypothetical protein